MHRQAVHNVNTCCFRRQFLDHNDYIMFADRNIERYWYDQAAFGSDSAARCDGFHGDSLPLPELSLQ